MARVIRTSTARYFSRIRLQDILVLQGPPLLGAAFAITHVDARDVATVIALFVGNLLLIAHVFMLNDWAGLEGDLSDPNKAARVFTARGAGRREVAAMTAACLIASLAIFAFLGTTPALLALAIAVLSALYSLPRFDWKGKPLLNSAAHLLGGIVHFLLGYCVAHALDARGVAIAAYFALIFVAGHLTQEVRDYAGDVLNAIRTNAVTFGPRRTFIASVTLFACAHALFLGLAFANVIPRSLAAVVALFAIQLYWSDRTLRRGLTYASVARLQTRYRVLYAFIGACIVAAIMI